MALRRPAGLRQGCGKAGTNGDTARMAESPRLLEVVVVERDGSWDWQVQSDGAVLASGTGRTRLLARFLGNDARLRLLAEDGKG